ncbi:MAG TPA: ferrous iron transport protein A [Firmicutes bacterium]|nr:ferrous iron transport protein A [Bacillota bacterium]
MPLTFAQQGETTYIKRITAKEDAKRYLAGLGLVEGAAVTVVSHHGEDMILYVKGARVALGRNYTKRIMI